MVERELEHGGSLAPCLLAPAGRSISVRLDEGPDDITGLPTGYEWWTIWIPSGPVVLGLVVAAVYGWDRLPGLFGGPVGALCVVAVTSGAVAAIILGGMVFVNWLNARIAAHGPFFYADVSGRWLRLPRSGVRIDGANITCFLEVRAWHTVKDNEGSNSEWIGELSVLVRGEGGETVRYPVVTAMRADVVGRVGRRLAELYRVDYRELQ
jgi:hypothetical protein